MNEFKNYHPLINLIYFVLVIGFSMILMNPVCLGVSVVCSVMYSVILSGKKGARRSMLYIIPMIILMSVINPLFCHEGITILFYLPNGNPITAEAVLYGFAAAMMLGSVICWFSCYNNVMTSDKLIYLFGKIMPSFSLVISMTFRFVPLFSARIKEVSKAQKCIGKSVSEGNIIKRAKHGLEILSGMLSWSLENSVETSDSMKARGHGLGVRTSFSLFRFDGRDIKMLIYILTLGGYVLYGKIMGFVDFEFFPYLKSNDVSFVNLSIPIVYLMLCISPVICRIWEVRKWRIIKSKI